MVDTRSGKSTTPYTQAQEERAAAILKERKEMKEKKELLKQAKLKTIAEEQAAKRKRLEEEMMRLQKEEEEKRRASSEVEEEPLERRRREERGETSGTKGEDEWMEKEISEWVANLLLGEDEEAMLYVPQEEREAFARRLEAMEDPLDRQTAEDEKRLEWKLRLAREKKSRREEANRVAKEVEKIQACRQEVQAQEETPTKLDKILGYISRKALKKLRLGLKVQKLEDPIVSVLADNRTMRVENYVEGVKAYFRLEKDGKVERVLHSLTLLVQDDLPFDIVLGMDWGEAAGATLHLREHECRLPSPSGEVKTARLFHASGVYHSLAHCCLSAPAFARLVKKEQLEDQVFVAYIRPVTEPKEEEPIDPAIAKLLEEFKDLTEPPTGVVSRLIQHRIEIAPGSRTPKGAVYKMYPRELEELRKQLDELLGKGWKHFFDTLKPPDFYVKIKTIGVPCDRKKAKTEARHRTRRPNWEQQTFSFPLAVPELALLFFEAWDEDTLHKDDFAGQACFPIGELRPGVRVVPLLSKKGEPMGAALLCSFKFVTH
ncbi:hypothetical protein CBR_g23176 [Chara braunii]|uniref:phosphoinositide phospholipase C n=1 Tax=Chara braunii TaxID=69332 RepID=A0A388JV39_CHABU|nr:hypothetical protein CBR_g23176 [Chara braunii]|eukprot:GBG61661.1 hypothetical protein CBR_g23176 [Chara braunii]